MDRLLSKRGFALAPLEPSVISAAQVIRLADPFDTAIAATALAMDLPLITKDQRITEAGIIDVVW